MAEKRIIKEQESKGGLKVADLILIAVLIAAGAVLKLVVGSVVNFFGMKPNFIIAMYCLAIAVIRPKVYQAAIIGLIVGAVCQFLPGTPLAQLHLRASRSRVYVPDAQDPHALHQGPS